MAQLRIKPLGSLCDILDSKREAITKRDRVSGEYPYYGATGIVDYVEHYIFDEPLVLVGEDGAKWGAGENTAFSVDGRCWVNNHAHVIRPHCDIVLDKWIIYYLNSSDLSPFITGLTVPKLNQEKLREIPIPLPPLSEQKRVVAVLDEAFEGIDATIANSEKNLANARDLFGGYLQHTFRDQEGWEERTLQQVSRLFGRGKSRHRPRNDPSLYDGPYRFIQTGEVRNCNHVILESSQTYNESGLAQCQLWPKGTICITIAANIAETGILGFDACFPDSIIGMVPDENKTTSDFVEYLLQATKTQLKAQGKGSAQDNINVATFENRRFLFPPLARQMEIADTLNALSDRVQQLEAVFEQKLVRLAELKQAILGKAFAGELTAHPEKALQEAAE